MKLPILLPDLPSQRFDCRGCTNCCRELVVHLTRLDREKIDRLGWAGRIDGPPYVRLGAEYVLNHRPGGGCVFLQADGKCRIHAEFGGEAKPLACQLYPFVLEADEQGLRVGLRFDCPTVTRNAGSPLTSHRATLGRLGHQLREQMPRQFAAARMPVLLKPGRALSAHELDEFVRRLDHWVSDSSVPLMTRLVGLVSLIDSLSAAKLNQIHDERFGELLGLLIADLPNDLAETSEPTPPNARQRKLLRQAVFAHCEHITLAQARASFFQSIAYRWGQLLRSRRIANATGALADLGALPTAALVRVNAVEANSPDPQSLAACDELLTRYVRARILSHSAFGPSYHGWPVLDGLAALLLTLTTAGWLARAIAASNSRGTFNVDDVQKAIGIVDRAAGRARELGARSARLRIAYLRRNHGLLRLLHAYSIIPAGACGAEAAS